MHLKNAFTIPGGTALIFMCLAGRSWADDLATETIQLHDGWNFVWLDLDPAPNDTSLVLQGVDFQTIWTFQPDPVPPAVSGSTVPGHWLFYDNDAPKEVSTLRFLQGQRGYLIKMNSTSQLTVAGRPSLRTQSFHAHVSNVFGALSNPLSPLPLTFERFFSHPTAQGKIRTSEPGAEAEIFTVAGNSLIRLSPTDRIDRNIAYWVNVEQSFDYRGPIGVSAGLGGVSFGRDIPRRTLSIEVPAPPQTARSLFVRALPCARLGGLPFCPGTFDASWLEYLDPNRDPTQPLTTANWLPLAAGVVVAVPQGQSSVTLDVRARRDQAAEMVAERRMASPAALNALIEISDEFGGQALLPTDVEVRPIFGIWLGQAILTHVSPHPDIQPLALEEAEAVPLRMTLILHVPDPSANPEGLPIKLLDSVSVPGHRDGINITRTFHATMFDRPVELQEVEPLDILGQSGTLTGTLAIQPEDPLNPYRHRYNPEHRVGYAIGRQITLQFELTADDAVEEGLGLDGTFGPNRVKGTYTEVIAGLSPDPITVQGSFFLDRLTDGAASPGPVAPGATRVSAGRQKNERRSQ